MNRTAIILLFLVLLLSACSAEASVDAEVVSESSDTYEEEKLICPRGITHDPYPGRCHLYTDGDGDGFCDYE